MGAPITGRPFLIFQKNAKKEKGYSAIPMGALITRRPFLIFKKRPKKKRVVLPFQWGHRSQDAHF
jgi:hypothetical protein